MHNDFTRLAALSQDEIWDDEAADSYDTPVRAPMPPRSSDLPSIGWPRSRRVVPPSSSLLAPAGSRFR